MSIECLPSDWWRKLRVYTRGWGVVRIAVLNCLLLQVAEIVHARAVSEITISPVRGYMPVVQEAPPQALPGTGPVVREAIAPALPMGATADGQTSPRTSQPVVPPAGRVPLPPMPVQGPPIQLPTR